MIDRLKNLLKPNPSESSTKKITVLISTLTDRKFSVKVKSTDNVMDLKKALESETSVPSDQMILVHNINGKDTQLSDASTLQNSDIRDNSKLKMILRL